ncbi:39S ribosomal protein L42, mitochondrial [Hyalella azteca]|uniref:Large ribosomal subunit protein mL42 n=1 Tax=Hyalella azteca TaxID=294128 RepID=A0A8B7N415_HYAAZ|nr:39S ribosomal protein L42, mitochondrial [Hyalella azteca]
MISWPPTKLISLTRLISVIGRRYYARHAGGSSYESGIPQTEPGREEAVILSNDGEMFVCWHPQPVIPYSCTRPLPDVPETDTVLNVQYNSEVKELFKRQHPYYVNQKLQKLTFTTKHRWFPKHDVWAPPKPPKDREYL